VDDFRPTGWAKLNGATRFNSFCKGKGKGVAVCETSPHRYGKSPMGSHSVTCHPAEVTFPAFTPGEAGTRFSDPEGMQG